MDQSKRVRGSKPDDAEGGIARPKRQQVARACTRCASSKRKCSGTFPCDRCVRLGTADLCIEVQAKRSKGSGPLGRADHRKSTAPRVSSLDYAEIMSDYIRSSGTDSYTEGLSAPRAPPRKTRTNTRSIRARHNPDMLNEDDVDELLGDDHYMDRSDSDYSTSRGYGQYSARDQNVSGPMAMGQSYQMDTQQLGQAKPSMIRLTAPRSTPASASMDLKTDLTHPSSDRPPVMYPVPYSRDINASYKQISASPPSNAMHSPDFNALGGNELDFGILLRASKENIDQELPAIYLPETQEDESMQFPSSNNGASTMGKSELGSIASTSRYSHNPFPINAHVAMHHQIQPPGYMHTPDTQVPDVLAHLRSHRIHYDAKNPSQILVNNTIVPLVPPEQVTITYDTHPNLLLPYPTWAVIFAPSNNPMDNPLPQYFEANSYGRFLFGASEEPIKPLFTAQKQLPWLHPSQHVQRSVLVNFIRQNRGNYYEWTGRYIRFHCRSIPKNHDREASLMSADDSSGRFASSSGTVGGLRATVERISRASAESSTSLYHDVFQAVERVFLWYYPNGSVAKVLSLFTDVQPSDEKITPDELQSIVSIFPQARKTALDATVGVLQVTPPAWGTVHPSGRSAYSWDDGEDLPSAAPGVEAGVGATRAGVLESDPRNGSDRHMYDLNEAGHINSHLAYPHPSGMLTPASYPTASGTTNLTEYSAPLPYTSTSFSERDPTNAQLSSALGLGLSRLSMSEPYPAVRTLPGALPEDSDMFPPTPDPTVPATASFSAPLNTSATSLVPPGTAMFHSRYGGSRGSFSQFLTGGTGSFIEDLDLNTSANGGNAPIRSSMSEQDPRGGRYSMASVVPLQVTPINGYYPLDASGPWQMQGTASRGQSFSYQHAPHMDYRRSSRMSDDGFSTLFVETPVVLQSTPTSTDQNGMGYKAPTTTAQPPPVMHIQQGYFNNAPNSTLNSHYLMAGSLVPSMTHSPVPESADMNMSNGYPEGFYALSQDAHASPMTQSNSQLNSRTHSFSNSQSNSLHSNLNSRTIYPPTSAPNSHDSTGRTHSISDGRMQSSSFLGGDPNTPKEQAHHQAPFTTAPEYFVAQSPSLRTSVSSSSTNSALHTGNYNTQSSYRS